LDAFFISDEDNIWRAHKKKSSKFKIKNGENGGVWICRCVHGEEEGSGRRGKDTLWEKMERE
jgi:hypothetical protein